MDIILRISGDCSFVASKNDSIIEHRLIVSVQCILYTISAGFGILKILVQSDTSQIQNYLLLGFSNDDSVANLLKVMEEEELKHGKLIKNTNSSFFGIDLGESNAAKNTFFWRAINSAIRM